MRRSAKLASRIAASAVFLGIAASSPAAEVVVLTSVNTPAWQPALEALREGTGDHQLTEVLLHGNRATGEQALRDIEGRDVILVALGPLAAGLCRELAPEVPLAYGLVPRTAEASLRDQPNVVGVAYDVPVKNQLAAFRMVHPGGVIIGVVHSDAVAEQVADAESAAGLLRLGLEAREVDSERGVPNALRALLKDVDAIWLPADPILVGTSVRKFVLAEALKSSKPVYAFSAALVQEGALVSNGGSMESVGQQLAELVGRLAAGEPASDIGIRVPSAELVINQKVAKRLRIEIPPDALQAAAKIH
jgi:putative ABC transport system substrate-binding protein